MRLISANVNGIRAACKRGGLEWLAAQSPDVLALQEVRATPEQLAAALADCPFADWERVYAPGAAGRAGVAVLSRWPVVGLEVHPDLDASGSFLARTYSIGEEGAGRWVEAEVSTPGGRTVTVASAYVHTGGVGTPQQDDKLAFLDAIGDRLEQLRGRDAVLTGDFNVCHTQRDLKNWKGNVGKSGYLPEEQKRLSTWFESGWVDVGRAHAGDVEGPYTWWSWRGQAFDNDTGWRIDYQVASPSAAQRVESVSVGRAPSYAQRWSDHAAVVVDYAD